MLRVELRRSADADTARQLGATDKIHPTFYVYTHKFPFGPKDVTDRARVATAQLSTLRSLAQGDHEKIASAIGNEEPLLPELVFAEDMPPSW